MGSEISFKELMVQVFQKRWVRRVGLVPMTLFSLLAVYIFGAVLLGPFLRPPNYAPCVSFDGPALIGWFFGVGVSMVVGICAVFTAYFMRGIFKILYFSGAMFWIGVSINFPVAVLTTPNVDFNLELEDPQFLVGTWMDDRLQLELSADSTFVLTGYSTEWFRFPTGEVGGTWLLDGNNIYFSQRDRPTTKECMVTESEGFYFITYEEIVDLDGFSGNLGLMREEDWLANQ